MSTGSTWRHKIRGSLYTELGRGSLQCSSQASPKENDIIVVYRDKDGALWFRLATEFDDGRFEPVTAINPTIV